MIKYFLSASNIAFEIQEAEISAKLRLIKVGHSNKKRPRKARGAFFISCNFLLKQRLRFQLQRSDQPTR